MALTEAAMSGDSLFITRAATVVSMQQLLDEEPAARLPAVALTPDQPVANIVDGGLLPLVSFAATPGIQAKRVRSFGDLAVVPDADHVDDPRRGPRMPGCAWVDAVQALPPFGFAAVERPLRCARTGGQVAVVGFEIVTFATGVRPA